MNFSSFKPTSRLTDQVSTTNDKSLPSHNTSLPSHNTSLVMVKDASDSDKENQVIISHDKESKGETSHNKERPVMRGYGARIGQAKVAEIVKRVAEGFSKRETARMVEVSESAVSYIWLEYGPKSDKNVVSETLQKASSAAAQTAVIAFERVRDELASGIAVPVGSLAVIGGIAAQRANELTKSGTSEVTIDWGSLGDVAAEAIS